MTSAACDVGRAALTVKPSNARNNAVNTVSPYMTIVSGTEMQFSEIELDEVV